MPKPLCIYHANCADGFAAAWVVRKFFEGEVDFFAAQYGHVPPDVAGRDVIMVDFSYKRPVLKAMAEMAHSVIVLDHHKTAEEELRDSLPMVGDHIKPYPSSVAWWEKVVRNCGASMGHYHALFDMERSGAGLTWDFFFPQTSRLRLIDHVEDRDLWRFNLNGTRQVQSCVVSYPFDFEVWDRLMDRAERDQGHAEMFAEGNAIDRKLQQDIASILATPPRRMVLGGVSVPVVNAPGMWASDMAGKLAETEPFGAIYFDTPTERVFSLRSRGEGGADVAIIAKSYGGGGHRNAAGFQMPLGWEGDK